MIAITDRPQAAMLLDTYETPRIVDGKTLSKYQANMLHFVEHGHGDGIVGAVAGSGKTTTLVMCARILTCDALFVAFNKGIADELAKRLDGTKMIAKTLHSVGLAALTKTYGRMLINKDKYRDLAEAEVFNVLPAGLRGEKSAERAVAITLAKLCDMTRLTLTTLIDDEAVTEMCEQYSIDVPDHESKLLDDQQIRAAYIAAAQRMILLGERLATGTAHSIDFTDMIYLPVRLGLTPAQASFVMVDECQDLNRAQLELVLSCRRAGGRMLFVGDPRQAIYGFAGADCDSFWTISQSHERDSCSPLSDVLSLPDERRRAGRKRSYQRSKPRPALQRRKIRLRERVADRVVDLR
jgi:DNA helicase-2/ATP-dependent DNA helicase PcrA